MLIHRYCLSNRIAMRVGFIFFLFASMTFRVHAQIEKAVLSANGLTCSMCSNATYNQLRTLPFLDSVDTDVEHTRFILYFKPQAPFDLRMIRSRVEDAGFSVGSLVLYMKMDQVAIENDFHYSMGDVTFHFMDSRKQTLSGLVPLKVLDKGFVSDKEYKKYLKWTSKYPCYATGKMDHVRFLYHLKVVEK